MRKCNKFYRSLQLWRLLNLIWISSVYKSLGGLDISNQFILIQISAYSRYKLIVVSSRFIWREVKEPEMKDYQWENALTHHLCEIWRPPALSLFQCVTHIHRITKLSFKSTCLNCNSIICNGECENHLCNPDHGTKFSASAR